MEEILFYKIFISLTYESKVYKKRYKVNYEIKIFEENFISFNYSVIINKNIIKLVFKLKFFKKVLLYYETFFSFTYRN